MMAARLMASRRHSGPGAVQGEPDRAGPLILERLRMSASSGRILADTGSPASPTRATVPLQSNSLLHRVIIAPGPCVELRES